MTRDARFEEGGERPLRLKALDEGDLSIISSLVQDSVLPRSEVVWQKNARRFGLLLNRFRWEDAAAAGRSGRPVERVRSVLAIEDVRRVQTLGLEDVTGDTILCLLSLEWEGDEDGGGALTLNLAGDGAIRVEVEALEVLLRDVTRPYIAPSGRTPEHP